MNTPPPRIDDAGAAARLRGALAEAGFTEDVIDSRVPVPPGTPPLAAGVAHDLALRDAGDRGSVLLRLLVQGTPVAVSDAAAALAPATPDDLLEMGLAAPAGGGCIATTARVVETAGLLLVSDRGGLDPRPDVVLGANVPARILAHVTSRAPVATALDLGTGGGIQALLAAAHAERVVGIDLNERALRFAEANAALNGVTNVEWMQGSWLDPVAGRQFDLIVSNPPFVISPDANLLYRDGGFDGDGVTRHVIAESARHLAPGGLAYLTGNWASPLTDTLDGLGCDALVLEIETLDPAEYAARWTSPRLAHGIAEYEATVTRWYDHYKARGIESITFGVVVLRRVDGAGRVRVVDVPDGVTGPCAEHVLRLLDGPIDPAGGVDPDCCYRLVDGLRIQQTLAQRDGRYRSHPAVIRLPGLGVKASVDPAALRVLFTCDGTRTLGEAAALASDADPRPDHDKVSDAIRALLHTGLAEAAE